MYRPTKTFWVHLLFGMFFFSILFIVVITDGLFKINNFFYFLIAIFFLFYPQTVLRIRSYFIYKKNFKRFSVPTQYEFDESGVETTNEFTSSKSNWNNFSKFVANDKTLLLYLSSQIAMIIPKTIPDKDWDNLIKLVKSKIVTNPIIYKHTNVFSLCNDEVEGWLDGDSCVVLRAINKSNDPVWLTANQAREVAKKITEAADELDRLDGLT
jgi:hypothetical protein